ncbi:hypothetical protein JL107_16805 [Nakamurella flavida]|uniref:Uncharacterized protein n=1 Tax=Nakamurella flavida TaxID=363630 RepID=A0A939C4H8_9ACTN|nr:hypothetical protein [Nakamurella flavida]MBM9478111.1 hypothetical protein [Nakamurella flavida]MDP9778668.1 hypothetical protein [Nakamurella flavida]
MSTTFRRRLDSVIAAFRACAAAELRVFDPISELLAPVPVEYRAVPAAPARTATRLPLRIDGQAPVAAAA